MASACDQGWLLDDTSDKLQRSGAENIILRVCVCLISFRALGSRPLSSTFRQFGSEEAGFSLSLLTPTPPR